MLDKKDAEYAECWGYVLYKDEDGITKLILTDSHISREAARIYSFNPSDGTLQRIEASDELDDWDRMEYHFKKVSESYSMPGTHFRGGGLPEVLRPCAYAIYQEAIRLLSLLETSGDTVKLDWGYGDEDPIPEIFLACEGSKEGMLYAYHCDLENRTIEAIAEGKEGLIRYQLWGDEYEQVKGYDLEEWSGVRAGERSVCVSYSDMPIIAVRIVSDFGEED